MDTDAKFVAFSVASIVLALIALVNSDYTIIIVLTATILFTLYYAHSLESKINKISELAKELSEKLNIYERMSKLESDVKLILQSLKMGKKGAAEDNDFVKVVIVIVAIVLLYLIYKAITAKLNI